MKHRASPYALGVSNFLTAENDDAGDEAVSITIEEAVEKLESSGIEVRPAPNPAGASRTSTIKHVRPSCCVNLCLDR